MRPPASLLDDSTVRPIFLVRFPLMKPPMVRFCQPVALPISDMAVPCFRRRSSRTIAFLVRGRSPPAEGGATFFLRPAAVSFWAARVFVLAFDAFGVAGWAVVLAADWLSEVLV